MSGVYIKGMEMPTSCFYCPFREKSNPDDYVCLALNKEFEETFSLIIGMRHKNCPLVSVPDHGRTVDVDALYREMFVGPDGQAYPNHDVDNWPHTMNYRDIKRFILSAPTVLPADKEAPT